MTQLFVKNAEAMVREFMTAFDQRIYPAPDKTPCEVSLLRSALIKEEAKEMFDSKAKTAEELDGLCDLLYVVLGTNIAMSVPVHPTPESTSDRTSFWPVVWAVTQDLDSRFPCLKIQSAALRKLTHKILDIAVFRGYKFEEAFKAVHEANMGKLWDHWPKPDEIAAAEAKGAIVKLYKKKFLVKRADGKVVKPPTFKAPDLTQYL